MSAGRTAFTSISIRVTPQERDRLDVLAGGRTLSEYGRECLLGDQAVRRKSRNRQPGERDLMLAQSLARLSASNIPNNINQLAKAVHQGMLILPPEKEALLQEACRAIIAVRSVLLHGLDMRGSEDR